MFLRKCKRMIAFLMALIMTFSLLPVSAFATETGTEADHEHCVVCGEHDCVCCEVCGQAECVCPEEETPVEDETASAVEWTDEMWEIQGLIDEYIDYYLGYYGFVTPEGELSEEEWADVCAQIADVIINVMDDNERENARNAVEEVEGFAAYYQSEGLLTEAQVQAIMDANPVFVEFAAQAKDNGVSLELLATERIPIVEGGSTYSNWLYLQWSSATGKSVEKIGEPYKYKITTTAPNYKLDTNLQAMNKLQKKIYVSYKWEVTQASGDVTVSAKSSVSDKSAATIYDSKEPSKNSGEANFIEMPGKADSTSGGTLNPLFKIIAQANSAGTAIIDITFYGQLTFVVTNGGSVAVDGAAYPGAATYYELGNRTLVATPAPGYQFEGWYEGETKLSAGAEYIYENTGNATITAKFHQPQESVTFAPAEGGTFTVDGETVTESVTKTSVTGTTYTLTATADTANGYTFAGWWAGDTLISEDNPYTYIHDKNQTVTPRFVKSQMTVTFKPTEGGSYTINGETVTADVVKSDPAGTEYTLVASANSHAQEFLGWFMDDAAEPFSTELEYTFVTGTTNEASCTVTPKFRDKAIYAVTVNYDAARGTVSGTGNVYEGDSTTLAATANSGYTFLGFTDGDGKIWKELTFAPTAAVTLNAVFAKATDNAWFKVDDTYLVNDLTTAAQKGTKIVLAADGVLPAGNYTIPSGDTLLIPMADEKVYTTQPNKVEETNPNPYMTPTASRKLTMVNGATITVKGAISVAGSQIAGGSSGVMGGVHGPVGFIDMAENSKITVDNGGKLYVWGYIVGDGAVEVKSGGTAYENFQVMDWRGGSVSSSIVGANLKNVFPMSQYYVQNVEVPMTLYAGAIEKGYTSTTITALGVQGAEVPFVGSENCLFIIDSGYIIKDYDEKNDRQVYEVHGDVSMKNIHIDMQLGLGSMSSVDSKDYVLPITSNLTVKVVSGTISITEDLAFLPGSEIIIWEGAVCQLLNDKSVYVYDVDDWGGYCGDTNKQFIPLRYAPGRTGSRTVLTDAKIEINGTVNAVAGYLYTTIHGADITGTGKVNMKLGNAEETYQITQQYPNYTNVSIPVVVAKLQNSDGTTTDPATEINPTGGTTYTYDAASGKWVPSCNGASSCVVPEGVKTCQDAKCIYCGDIKIPASDSHTPGTAATCTEPQTCTVCGDVMAEALGHSYQTVPAKADTCKEGEAGYKESQECTRCKQHFSDKNGTLIGDGSERDFEAWKAGDGRDDSKQHTWGSPEEVSAPTCTAPGSNKFTCTVCSGTKTEPVAALNHQPKAAVEENKCADTGIYESVVYCGRENCGAEVSRTVIVPNVDTASHTLVLDPRVEPTCTQSGLTAGAHCTDGECGFKVAQKTIEALGHTVDASKIHVEWNSTDKTWTATATCTVESCKATVTETVAVDPTKTVTDEATCEDDGSVSYTSVEFVDPTFVKAALQPATKTEPLTMLNHDWSAVVVYTYWNGENQVDTLEEATTCVATQTCKHETTESCVRTQTVAVTATKVPTSCTVDGSTTYIADFTVEWAENQTKKVAGQLATGHTYTVSGNTVAWNADTTSATCTATLICKCGETIPDVSVAATESERVKATCEGAGKVIYTATFVLPEGTEGKMADDQQPLTHEVTLSALNHDWEYTYDWSNDNATCTATRVCQNDSSHTNTETAEAEHTCTATCEGAGEDIYTVTFQNKNGEGFVTKHVKVAREKLGHDPVKVEAKASTCAEKGVQGNNEYYTCSRCSGVFEDEACTVSTTVKMKTLPYVGHKFTNYVYDNNRTCEKDGTKTALCDYGCGTKSEPIVDSTHPRSGHTYDDGVITTPPTCTEEGVRTFTCQNDWCDVTGGHAYTEHVEALGHSLIAHEGKESTCDVNGYSAYYQCTPSKARSGERSYCGYYFAAETDTAVEATPIAKNETELTAWQVKPAAEGGGALELRVCKDADFNHECDYDDCDKVMGTHVDNDKNHICDGYGERCTVGRLGGEGSDVTTDKDHKCDYCGAEIGQHEFVNGVCNCTYVQDLTVTITIKADGYSDFTLATETIKYKNNGTDFTKTLNLSNYGDCVVINSVEAKVGENDVDHSWTEDTVTVGYEALTGDVNIVVNAQQTHIAERAEVDRTEATCLVNGKEVIKLYCSKCHQLYSTLKNVIPAKGEHTYDEGVYTEPTFDADGYTTYTCQYDQCDTAGGHIKTETATGTKLIAVAKVGAQRFETLEEAIEAVGNRGTITLLSKYTIEGYEVWDLGKRVTLYVPAVEDNYGLIVKGDLTIKSGTYVVEGMYGIGVTGKLTIDGGTFEVEEDNDYLIGSWGTTVINGGEFVGQYNCVNGFAGSLTITGGTFETEDKDATGEWDSYDVLAEDGVATITGGTFSKSVAEYVPETHTEVNRGSYYEVTTHKAGEPQKENIVPATCTEPGSYDEVTRCVDCNEVLKRETGKVIPAAGHTVTVIEGKTATCTEPGYKEAYYCSVCEKYFAIRSTENEKVLSDEITVELSVWQTEGEGKVVKPHNGYLISATAMTCVSNGNNAYYKCSVCQQAFVDEDCQTPTTDAEQIVYAVPHAYGEGKYLTEDDKPTCTESGTLTFTCQNEWCNVEGGYIRTETVDKLNHHYDWDGGKVVTEPTCTADGYTTYDCSRCDETHTGDKVSKTGHTSGQVILGQSPTCTENGWENYYQCQNSCGLYYEDASYTKPIGDADALDVWKTTGNGVKPAWDHNYTAVDGKAPDCTNPGYLASFKCTNLNCFQYFTEDEDGEKVLIGGQSQYNAWVAEGGDGYIKANGHTPGEVKTENVVAPKCEENGSHDEVTYCTVCQTETSRVNEVDNMTGHTGERVVKATAPTCTDTGLTEGKYCDACDKWTEPQAVVDAKGHTIEETAEVAPKCNAFGTKAYYYCKTCELYFATKVSDTELSDKIGNAIELTQWLSVVGQGKIDKLPHTEEIDAYQAPTCTEPGLTEGKHCKVCGHVIKAQDTIPKNGHTETIDAAKAATCTEPGLTEGKHCSVCQEILIEQETVNALGHSGELVKGQSAKCEQAGWKDYYQCKTCKKYFVDADCTQPIADLNAWRTTGDGVIAGLEHKWDDGLETTLAECEKTGVMTFTCEYCNGTRPEEIPELGHDPVQHPGQHPTYYSSGWEPYETCTRCNHTTMTGIPALGEPSVDTYEEFMTSLKLLEEYANAYVKANPGKDPMALLIKYVRTGVDRYNSGSWQIMAGYEDEAFAEYVKDQEDAYNKAAPTVDDMINVTGIKNIKNFTLLNGQSVDFGHMFGTMDITYHNKTSINHADVSGWAGDLVDLLDTVDRHGVTGTVDEMIKEIGEKYLNHSIEGESDQFSQTDMYGDLDGYYFMNELIGADYEAGMLYKLMDAYFTESLTDAQRADYLLKNRLGGVTGRNEIREAVFNEYLGNSMIATLEGTRDFKNEDVSDLRKASCYAFADYLCKLAGDYVELGDNPYFTVFSSELSTLAPGITQQINKATMSDGKQVVYYTAIGDVTSPYVSVYANYKDNDPASGWGMQRVRDQANAAQEKYGNPDSEEYIPNYNVIAAINGAGYNMTTGEPGGVLMMGGVEYHAPDGGGFFGIRKDGTACLGSEAEYYELKEKGELSEAIAIFGTVLIKDGKLNVTTNDYGRASRTAIGYTKTGKVVFMVMDGRQEPVSCGGSLAEIAQVMLEAGCVWAVNLDGGGSTTYLARQEGDEGISLVSSPSDGFERSVATSWIMVSTAPSSTAFDHAVLNSEVRHMTVGASTQVTAAGVSATGNSVELPEGTTWAVSDSSIASISSDGVVTGLANGTFDVRLMLGDQIIGSRTMYVVVPDAAYFTKENMNAVYGESTQLPVAALFEGKPVAVVESDFYFTLSNEAAGTTEGIHFIGNEKSGIKTVKISAHVVNNSDAASGTMGINMFRADEASFDFENADGGDRLLAWNRVVSNSTTADGNVYTVVDVEQPMVTEYTFGMDMTQIPIPEQLNDLIYMLPGADVEGNNSAWDFLLQLAERVSVRTHVKATLKLDPNFDVDYSGLSVNCEYFNLEETKFDPETNELTLTLYWKDQTKAIDPDTANPLVILAGIKLTPKEDAAWGAKDRLTVVNAGDISYDIYLRANALYSFASKLENQEAFGLQPFYHEHIIINGAPESGGHFADTYKTFSDEYTLNKGMKNGWVYEDGGYAYYEDDVKYTGIRKVGQYYYDFGENGINIGQTKYSGMFQIGGVNHYSKEGVLSGGWYIDKDDKYYFDDAGKAVDGEFVIDEVKMVFDNGLLVGGHTGFLEKADGNTYYYQNGSMYYGWLELGDDWYHFNTENGIMTVGDGTANTKLFPDQEAKAKGAYYVFDAEGHALYGFPNNYGYYYWAGQPMRSLWVLNGYDLEGWYHTNDNGHYVTDPTGQYTFEKEIDGVLYTAVVIQFDGVNYTFDNTNGKLLLGNIVQESDKLYYYWAGEPFVGGWFDFEGETYYAYEDGHLATGANTIGGKSYMFTPQGTLVKNGTTLSVSMNEDSSQMTIKTSEIMGVNRVQMAVWSDVNQEDLVWFEATVDENGVWTAEVSMCQYENTGVYNIHAYEIAENGGLAELLVTTTYEVTKAGHTYDDNVDGTCNGCGVNRADVETRKVVHMFRMYNPYTGEHFYTGSEVERDNLVAVGWKYEGVGFTFPANTGAPVYRLYEPSTGEHLYTMDENEKNRLMADGWNYEGIAFNSAYDTEAVQYRLHNPYATVGAYHFTNSEKEKQNLIREGWEYQGIGWYSCWK